MTRFYHFSYGFHFQTLFHVKEILFLKAWLCVKFLENIEKNWVLSCISDCTQKSDFSLCTHLTHTLHEQILDLENILVFFLFIWCSEDENISIYLQWDVYLNLFLIAQKMQVSYNNYIFFPKIVFVGNLPCTTMCPLSYTVQLRWIGNILSYCCCLWLNIGNLSNLITCILILIWIRIIHYFKYCTIINIPTFPSQNLACTLLTIIINFPREQHSSTLSQSSTRWKWPVIK